MSNEPSWLRDCDVAHYRTPSPSDRAAEWLVFLIARLSPKQRNVAAHAWKNGETPATVLQRHPGLFSDPVDASDEASATPSGERSSRET